MGTCVSLSQTLHGSLFIPPLSLSPPWGTPHRVLVDNSMTIGTHHVAWGTYSTNPGGMCLWRDQWHYHYRVHPLWQQLPPLPNNEWWIPARKSPIHFANVPISGIHIFISDTNVGSNSQETCVEDQSKKDLSNEFFLLNSPRNKCWR
jgi:hypothetical protein